MSQIPEIQSFIINIVKLRSIVGLSYFADLSALLEELNDAKSVQDALEKIRSMLEDIADGDSLCRDCERHIWWMTTKRGKKMPVTNTGAVHWQDCPGAEKFRDRGFFSVNHPGELR